MHRHLIAAALAAVVATPVLAAPAVDIRAPLDASAQPAQAGLDAVKGIAGDWVGPNGAAGFSAPQAGEIVGHLLLTTATGPRVQELWIIRPENGSVLVRQKHVAPDLTDREDKNQWAQRKLVGFDAGHVFFENLTFVTGRDTLELHVRIPGQNGAAPNVLDYMFKRAK